MSVVIALDPKFLAGAVGSPKSKAVASRILFLERLLKKYENFICFGDDAKQGIRKAYAELNDQLIDTDYLLSFLKLIEEHGLIKKIPSAKTDSFLATEKDFLEQVGWLVPVNPELLTVGKSVDGNVCILVDIDDPTNDLQKVIEHYPTVPIWTSHEESIFEFFEWLASLTPRMFPDEDHLPLVASLREQYEIPEQEEETYEFKQPGRSRDGSVNMNAELSARIVIEALKGACAQLNSGITGYVFIGINETKNGAQILGFKPIYNGKQRNNDEINRLVRDFFERFYPVEVNRYIVPLVRTLKGSDRVVVVLKILSPGDTLFVFDNDLFCGEYTRPGTTSKCYHVVYWHGELSYNRSIYQISYWKNMDRGTIISNSVDVGEIHQELRGLSETKVIFQLSEDGKTALAVEKDTLDNRKRRMAAYVNSQVKK